MKAHNVEEGVGYATLTDIIYQAWAGLTAREYKNLKGLHQENLRDNMTNEELVMNMLAELTTTNITKEEHPQTMSEHARVAERGGSVARVAKEAFEEQTGKKVVSSQSMKQYLDSQQPKLDVDLLKRLMTLSELNDMKTIEVVAAIIVRNGEVFATQRGYGEFKGWWEFPGGKIESGECPQEALKREIREELDAEIAVGDLLETIEWDYPNFHLTMHCFICSLLSESMHLNEHEAATWLNLENLRSVKWLPADVILLDRIAEYLRRDPAI